MTAVLLVIHVIVAISMIVVILLQRSEGGALGSLGGGGSGGGGGGFGGLMSGRQSANLLTRITTILAACFMGMSMLLAILASQNVEPTSILDQQRSPAPAEAPAEPAAPTAPVAQ